MAGSRSARNSTLRMGQCTFTWQSRPRRLKVDAVNQIVATRPRPCSASGAIRGAMPGPEPKRARATQPALSPRVSRASAPISMHRAVRTGARRRTTVIHHEGSDAVHIATLLVFDVAGVQPNPVSGLWGAAQSPTPVRESGPRRCVSRANHSCVDITPLHRTGNSRRNRNHPYQSNCEYPC